MPGIRSAGVGDYLEYDTRDMPTNAYRGRYLKVDALFNDEAIGSDNTYQNYSFVFNTYQQKSDSLVLAGQVQGCLRGGYARDAFSDIDNREWIPSYGVGLRFMVLKSKRVNMRLDYARSSNSDAFHFMVGEAF